jgi:lysine-N-methylase
MSERKRLVLEPQYMKSFHCIGSSCEDSCCVGWRVDIDQDTYKKYRKIKSEEMSVMMEKNVTRNRSTTKSGGNYAKVKLAEGGACPFLNAEMLCRIQLEHGEEYLSNVCTTYPRTTNIINGLLERSATMSCPEVARMALLKQEPMEFDQYLEAAHIRNIAKNDINTEEIRFANKPERYLWELRVFSITLLQDRNLRLWERLIALGIFYDKAQELIKTERAAELPDLIASLTAMIEDGSVKKAISNIPIQNTIQMELLKEIADKRYFLGVNNNRYLECFGEFLNGVYYTVECAIEEIGQRYHESWKKYYEPYMENHEYILENYMVNYIFKNLFPFTGEKTLFDAYMMLVIHYSLIKLHLIGMAGYHKGLTDELVVKLVQSFAKTVEHNQKYLNEIADLMKQNGFNTMAYMSILAKN